MSSRRRGRGIVVIVKGLPKQDVILSLVCPAVMGFIGEQGHLEQVAEGQGEPVVPGFVVELKFALVVIGVRGDAVVLGDADAAAEHVARGLPGLHGEGAGLDDLDAPVAGEGRALLEAADAVGPLGKVVGAIGDHLELEAELGVGEHEVGHGAAPGAQAGLGLLDEDVEAVGVLL